MIELTGKASIDIPKCKICGKLKSIRTIIQPIGTAGPIDPLDQFGSIFDIENHCKCWELMKSIAKPGFEEKVDKWIENRERDKEHTR